MSNNKNVRIIAEGNWLNLAEITYTDAYGKERKWETVGRYPRRHIYRWI